MSKKTPHFFVLGIPKKNDRCPNAVYFLRTSSGVSMYVTDSNSTVFPVTEGASGAIGSLVSPQGTISVVINGAITEIDISQSILDELDAIRNAIVQPPDYIPPSASINFGLPSTVEAGTNLSRIVSANFTQNDAGEVNNIRILRDGFILADQDTSQNTLAIGDNFTIERETVTHTCQIAYDEGITKENNLGVEDPTGKIQAGTITANSDIVGRLRIFYGSNSQFYTNSQDIRDNLSSVFENSTSFDFQASERFMTIAIPEDKDINNIVTSNNETLTGNFLPSEQIITVVDADFSPYNYKLYTYSTALPLNVTVTVTL